MPLFLFRVCVYVIIFIFKPLKKTSFLLPYSCFCKYTFIEVSKKYCLRPHCLLTDKKTACHLANSRSPIFEKGTHKTTFSLLNWFIEQEKKSVLQNSILRQSNNSYHLYIARSIKWLSSVTWTLTLKSWVQGASSKKEIPTYCFMMFCHS